MSAHYDPRLRDIIGAGNGSGPVMNRSFARWEESITAYLANRRLAGEDKFYGRQGMATLHRECETHRKRHERGNQGAEKAIVLVHPLYMHLSHIDLVEAPEQAEQYLEMMIHLVRESASNPKVSIVLIETIDHYAAASSVLVEKGLVDRVLFTQSDRGYLLNPKEARTIRADEFFFAGGYNEACLSFAMMEFYGAQGKDRLCAIQGMVLESPQDSPKDIIAKDVVLQTLEWGILLKQEVLPKRKVRSIDEVLG